MILFEHVSKTFSSRKKAVIDLNFEIKKGETIVLLGQSGSGKTTALRLINRLIEPTSGRIFFDGKDIMSLDPTFLRRKIGYAIQHIGLFLHMTVAENIGIVPKLLNWERDKIEGRVDEMLNMVGLDPKTYRELLPGALSGGQKQRIGVARALAADPPVILMDEPFGALDPLMREQLQNEFLEIQSKIHKTVVFVTHDLSEAVKIGDRIAILDEGRLIQIASCEELLEKPANRFIEAFLGKERFQLLLQTKSLYDLRSDLKPGEQRQMISLRSSLMEALMTFKISGNETLSVFDDQTYIGNLTKEKFLENLLTTL